MRLTRAYATTDRRRRTCPIPLETAINTGTSRNQTITKQDPVWSEAVRMVPTRLLGFIRDPRGFEF